LNDIYPYKMFPVLKEKIWGGTLALKYKLDIIEEIKKYLLPIGEYWEISDHDQEQSIVINGKFKGYTLNKLIKTLSKEAMLGNKKLRNGRFPILFKILDTSKVLSVQVHPDADTAKKLNDKEGSKFESWYIIERREGACIYLSIDCENKEEFMTCLKTGKLKEKLIKVPVNPQDAFFIPPGTLHAIGPGILLAEIQENSDTTYRVYDWDRPGKDGKPRELHIDKAIECLEFPMNQNFDVVRGTPYKIDGLTIYPMIKRKEFSYDEFFLKGKAYYETKGSFLGIFVFKGEVKITTPDTTLTLYPLQTALCPAALEEIKLASEVYSKGLFISY